MSLTVYQHPKCTSCKKAISFLDKKKVDYRVIDITQKAPTKSELKKMLGFMGGEVKKLFNTSGIQYRELGLSKKVPEMSEKDALDLLASNGMLVKRPFILSADSGVVGFKEDKFKEII